MTIEPQTTKKKFNLNKHTARLLMQEPFFAGISRRVDKTSTTAIPTAGVRLNKATGYFEMLYNPDFFESLTDKQKLGVLKHEFYHLIFQHVTERLPEDGMSKIWNVATDLAINSHLIGELPENGCIPSQKDTPFENYPVGLSAEAYLKMLKEDKQFQKKDGEDGEDGEGGGSADGGSGESMPDTMDDHGDWGDSAEGSVENDIAKERLREMLEQASKEANRGNNWGTVSSDTRQMIQKYLNPSIDWRKMLSYFIKTSRRANKRSTIRRLNRRYPRIHSGSKVTRVANIAISIDQSGSVSDFMLAQFFAELNNLSKLATFTVVPFDTEVREDKVFTWKKGQNKEWERVLSGGTCFNAPTKYVNKGSYDGHIVLTDMMAPKPVPSKCQRMWITDDHGKSGAYFDTNEIVLAIKGKE
jgi:predicted metal-dependent peptidase